MTIHFELPCRAGSRSFIPKSILPKTNEKSNLKPGAGPDSQILIELV